MLDGFVTIVEELVSGVIALVSVGVLGVLAVTLFKQFRTATANYNKHMVETGGGFGSYAKVYMGDLGMMLLTAAIGALPIVVLLNWDRVTSVVESLFYELIGPLG